MKIRMFLSGALIALVFGISGCGGGNNELKKDAEKFADAMCRNIETMQKLRAANPGDSVLLVKLQAERQQIDSSMADLIREFKTKYGGRAERPEFTKLYRKYLNESMLKCKFLSKEDRENFEREVN